MVLNKKDLEKAFSPGKTRKKRLSLTTKCENSANMRVVVRIRPQNDREIQSNCRSVIKVVDENTLIFDPKDDSQAFFYHGIQQMRRDLLKKQNKELECVFDQVFDCSSTNQNVFDGSTKDMIASLLDGYNCSVFAYGATGAGKTFTMLGNGESPGITYLTMAELYKQIDALKEEKDFELGISHLEVYNENVQDLIKPSGPLHLREDGNCGILVAGLSVHRIHSAEELLLLLERGNRNRTQHPTDANAESSRSHAVFQVYIRMISKLSKQTKIVKLSMIDLAGSERGSATGCKGMRFTEGANINRSLLALGNCINKLADGLKHIPYRDSKLTRLLKDSLGGNCRTVMIANVSPANLSYEDTYNTLRYALRAKKIRSTLKKNIVSLNIHASRYAKMVEELSTEVESLKEKLKLNELKLKQYESGDSNNEAKPGTSRSVDPPIPTISEKCKEFLALQETKRALYKEIWKWGKEIKTLKWRIKQKHNTALSLPDISINSSEMNKSISRIRTSVSQFEGRAASIREKLKHSLCDLKMLMEKEIVLVTELEQNGSLGTITKEIELSRLTLEKEEKSIQTEHLQQLLGMQQKENESNFKINRELSTTLREYHYTLMGHDKMTCTMNSHYQKLVRMLEGVKVVTWQEDMEIEDSASLLNMKDFCDLSIPSLDRETKQSETSSKIFEEISVNFSKQFPLSSFLSHTSVNGQTSQNSNLHDTTEFVTSSPRKNKIMSQEADSAQLKVAFQLPNNFQLKLPSVSSTFIKSETEIESGTQTVPKNGINAEVLNSTFEIQKSPKKIMPPDPKSRVLVDHNRMQPSTLHSDLTIAGIPNTKKRSNNTPPNMVKIMCNKENREVFAKPKLPPPSRNPKQSPLKRQNLLPNSSKIRMPLNKGVNNIPRITPHKQRLSNNPMLVSPRLNARTQKQFKPDWCKMPVDKRRSQSFRMKPYTTPSKSKTG